MRVFERVVKQIETTRALEIGQMVFDKDDCDALEFVIAASNIRAHNFSIESETAFKIKEMAGKIIPAISSSNALVASMQVHEAIKLLLGKTEQLKLCVYNRLDSQRRLVSSARKLENRNIKCPICSDDSLYIGVITLPSLAETTLQVFIDEILPKYLDISPSKILMIFGNDIVYERDDEMSDEEIF